MPINPLNPQGAISTNISPGQTKFVPFNPAIDAADTSPGGIGQYRAGGPNKIVWAGDVSSSNTNPQAGGETSWNPETNSVQYVAGYDNTGWSPPSAGPASSPASSGSASPGIASTSGAASGAALPSAAPDTFDVGGAGSTAPTANSPNGVPLLGSTGANVTPPSMTGLDAAATASAPGTPEEGGAQELIAPGGIKQGLGTRIPPSIAGVIQAIAY